MGRKFKKIIGPWRGIKRRRKKETWNFRITERERNIRIKKLRGSSKVLFLGKLE